MSDTVENKNYTSKSYKLLSAIGAALFWGSWSYYINPETPIRSSLTQAISSFAFTLLTITIVTIVYHKLRKTYLQITVPAFVTVGFITLCLSSIHTVIGTQNVVYTIMPALIVAFLFCLFTSYKLYKVNLPLSASK